MTPAEIDAMPAGPEMDALVGQRVFGTGWLLTTANGFEPKPHSTSDAAALEVLKKLAERFEEVDVTFRRWTKEQEPDVTPGEEWNCCAENHDMATGIFNASASTLALAICRAALKANQ